MTSWALADIRMWGAHERVAVKRGTSWPCSAQSSR